MKLIYLKSTLKSDSFDVTIDIKIPFFRILAIIEPGSLLTTVRYHKLFDNEYTSLFSSFTYGKLESVAYNTQFPEFFMEREPNFSVLFKNDQRLS